MGALWYMQYRTLLGHWTLLIPQGFTTAKYMRIHIGVSHDVPLHVRGYRALRRRSSRGTPRPRVWRAPRTWGRSSTTLRR
ncbi:hypothetical protein C2E23DRAFT_844325 [Lenzites betulinus]|nr:hypothetical protein C2E23DRAFT_844325 [Lenzites betulinus]